MAVGSYYQVQGIDVGPAVAGRFLDAYFNEIKAMNDLNDAALAEGGEDVADLNKMEIAARERLGKLHEALIEARSGDSQKASDLMRTVIQEASEERRNIRTENANIAMKRMEIAEKYRAKAEKDDAVFKEQIRISPDAAAKIGGFGDIARTSPLDADQLAAELGSQLDALAVSEKTGGAADPRYIRLVADISRSVARSGPKGAAAAKLLVEQKLPAAAAEGGDPDMYLLKYWAPATEESAQKEAEDLWRKAGGAGARGDWQSDVRAAGGDPAQVFGTGSSSVSRGTSGGSGGGSAAPREGGSIAIEGMSPEAAKAMRAAAERGADPYDAMMAAIEAQAAYADDLAARRKSAAAKGPRSPYPRPNAYTVSPNRYVKFDPTAPPPPVGDAAFQAEMKAWRNEPRTSRIDTLDITGDPLERDWRSQNPNYKPPAAEVVTVTEPEADPFAAFVTDWKPEPAAKVEEDPFAAFVKEYK